MKYPMEMHVVNVADAKSPDDSPQYLVISVLFRNGRKDQEIDTILDRTSKLIRTALDRDREHLEGFLSGEESQTYYHYRGALAMPPYDEVVDLFVLGDPRTASQEQMTKVRASGVETEVTLHTRQGVELVE